MSFGGGERALIIASSKSLRGKAGRLKRFYEEEEEEEDKTDEKKEEDPNSWNGTVTETCCLLGLARRPSSS